VSVTLSLVHWGLGLVVSALLARRIGQTAGRRGIPIHYPLVVAAAYAGFMSWHGGLSGSAPLTVATPGHFLESVIGVIPPARTVGSPRNLALSAALVVAIPLLMAAMAPREKLRGAPAELLEERSADPNAGRGRSRLDASTLLGLTIALAALALVVRSFRHKGFGALDFDLLNFAFLFLGLLVWRSPDAYARAISSGMSEASGIVLQFPFYAGILGMMKSTGMVDRLAQAGAAVGHGVFLVSTFVAATVVNMFVPSGGAQWGVQGPAVVQAAHQLGIPPERVVLAVAWGDEWSNMLQPFWALAVLGPTRLEARDIFGYTTLIMLLTGPLYAAALLW
jgi:short-chain fatty acids transporter